MDDLNLTYSEAHAYAYGYLSAEVRSAIRVLRRLETGKDVADALEKVLLKLDCEIEARRVR